MSVQNGEFYKEEKDLGAFKLKCFSMLFSFCKHVVVTKNCLLTGNLFTISSIFGGIYIMRLFVVSLSFSRNYFLGSMYCTSIWHTLICERKYIVI